MVMTYLPGSTFATGKLNWPLSSVTTVVVMVEPSFLALTSTPSIAPSSDEETWPWSVPDVCALAGNKPVRARTVVASNRALIRIVASLVCRLLAWIARMVAFFGRPRQVLKRQKENGRDKARPFVPHGKCRNSILRLDLDDRGAVVVADPEHVTRAAFVDKDAADIGRARQQILSHLAALGVEPRHQVGEHRPGPGLAVLGRDHVIGPVVFVGQDPLLDLRFLGVEHRDSVAGEFGEP